MSVWLRYLLCVKVLHRKLIHIGWTQPTILITVLYSMSSHRSCVDILYVQRHQMCFLFGWSFRKSYMAAVVSSELLEFLSMKHVTHDVFDHLACIIVHTCSRLFIPAIHKLQFMPCSSWWLIIPLRSLGSEKAGGKSSFASVRVRTMWWNFVDQCRERCNNNHKWKPANWML